MEEVLVLLFVFVFVVFVWFCFLFRIQAMILKDSPREIESEGLKVRRLRLRHPVVARRLMELEVCSELLEEVGTWYVVLDDWLAVLDDWLVGVYTGTSVKY